MSQSNLLTYLCRNVSAGLVHVSAGLVRITFPPGPGGQPRCCRDEVNHAVAETKPGFFVCKSLVLPSAYPFGQGYGLSTSTATREMASHVRPRTPSLQPQPRAAPPPDLTVAPDPEPGGARGPLNRVGPPPPKRASLRRARPACLVRCR